MQFRKVHRLGIRIHRKYECNRCHTPVMVKRKNVEQFERNNKVDWCGPHYDFWDSLKRRLKFKKYQR